MKHPNVSPCTLCSRVPCPAECDNLHCVLWRRWFLARWEQMRQSTYGQMNRLKAVPLGVPLGGRHYAPPHLIREYRANNPCENCSVGLLCKDKCNVRKRWEQQGGAQ